MNSTKLSTLDALQLGALALFGSVASALSVMFATRLWTGGKESDGSSPPHIEGSAVADRPGNKPVPHFSENEIIPGFTETGQQVERDDDTEGRSPTGV